ncbi:MAG TPA: hypothetical protein PLK47_17365, partial [Plasticicumulans sp.]|nr:hypothetical protein [Plasticicumulans sp.]
MEHALAEEAGAGAVVNDAALDIRHELLQFRFLHVGQGQAALLARARIRFGDDGHDAAVAVIGMRVAKLERAP